MVLLRAVEADGLVCGAGMNGGMGACSVDHNVPNVVRLPKRKFVFDSLPVHILLICLPLALLSVSLRMVKAIVRL